MSVAELIQAVAEQDIRLGVNGDKLVVDAPKGLITPELRLDLKRHKSEILDFLEHKDIQENMQEAINERAAIMEYDGGLDRRTAERRAYKAIRVYKFKITDSPRWITMIAPGCELAEVERDLRLRYGNRFIEVKRFNNLCTT